MKRAFDAPFCRSFAPFALVLLVTCSQHGTPSTPDASPHGGPVNVLTHHNDNARTGANTSETCLTPAVVPTLAERARLHVDGQVYAQPLLLTGERDLLIVASTANQVTAFDVTTLSSTPVWQLGPEALGVPGTVIRGIQGPLGILSTPVIDPVAQRLYVVARSCATAATTTSCPWTLHVVDTAAGKHLDSEVIATSFTDASGAVHKFDPDQQWNRPALLLQNGMVFVGFEVGQNANQAENRQTYHGYLMGYDTTNIHGSPMTFVTTPNGLGAGIWQSGGGPAGDGTAVYVNSGNSTMMPRPTSPAGFPATPRDHENSSIRLAVTGTTAQVTAYYDDRPYHSDGNVFQYINYWDYDLSASGIALIPGTNDLVFGSKSGIVYLLDKTTMQAIQPPISPFTEDPLPAGQTLYVSGYGLIPAVNGTPVVWGGSSGATVFMWPGSDHLTSFEYDSTKRSLQVKVISKDSSFSTAMLSLSANGTEAGSAVLWANLSTAGGSVASAADLRAYDPTTLKLLWHAALPGYAKWVCPTVSGGRVYVPSSTVGSGSDVYVFATKTCG